MQVIKSLFCCIVSLVGVYKSVFTVFRLAEFLHDQTLKNGTNSSIAAFAVGSTDCPTFMIFPILWPFLLLLLFVVQHTGMASKWYKEQVMDLGLQPIDRSIYIIATCFILDLIMANYPLTYHGVSLWSFDTSEKPSTWLFFFAFHILCWLIIYGTSILMDLPEFLGVKQVYHMCILEREHHPMLSKAYQAQVLYKHMRHSGCMCFILILWVHPVMTLWRLFLAAFFSLYLLLGFRVKDSDCAYIKEQRRRKAANLKLL